MRPKRFLSICTLLILFLTSSMAFSQEEVVVLDQRKVTKTYDMKSGDKLYVENSSGEVKINPWNKNKIEVTMTRRGRREDIEVYVDRKKGGIEIEVEHYRGDWRDGRSGSVYLDIKIPGNTETDIRSSSGDIIINDLSGAVEASASSGDILIRGVKNDIRANASSGDIEIEKVTGNIDVHTSSGSITLESISKEIEADASSGRIEIIASGCKIMDVSSSSGRLDVELNDTDNQGEYEFQASSGSIILSVPANTKADVTARARASSLHSDFDIWDNIDEEYNKKRDRDSNRSNYRYSYSRGNSRRTHRGDLNGGGGARISLSVSSGRIDLRKK